MKRSLTALAAVLLGVSMFGAGAAQATVVSYDFVFEFSGGDEPAGPAPWLNATFDDGGSAGSVNLTLSTAGLVDDEFVRQWYFNVEPFQTINFTHQSGEVPTSTQSSSNAFKADGDGFFDILIEYAANAADRFGAGLQSVLLLEAAGLTADMFQALSLGAGNSPDGLLAAAKVQGIGPNADGSGWVAPIPIMGALPLLLSALGLLGFAGGWWRRWLSD